MVREVAHPGKPCAAQLAHHGPPAARPPVDAHVSGQLVALQEGGPTLRAHVGLLPRVHPHVAQQVAGAVEGGVAQRAGVGLVAGVAPLVLPQGQVVREALLALVAHKRLLPLVRQQVAPVQAPPAEHRPTLGADVRAPRAPGVHPLDVLAQLEGVVEDVGALLAGVLAVAVAVLPQVSGQVVLEVVGLGEGRAAGVANKVLAARVRQHVARQVAALHEGQAALPAHVGALRAVGHHVPLQVLLLHEGGRALPTGERPVPQVALQVDLQVAAAPKCRLALVTSVHRLLPLVRILPAFLGRPALSHWLGLWVGGGRGRVTLQGGVHEGREFRFLRVLDRDSDHPVGLRNLQHKKKPVN